MRLGELIDNYIKSNNLSLRAFAARCENVSHTYIGMLIRGEHPKSKKPIIPSLETLSKVAQGMGMSLHKLIQTIDDMPVSLNETSDSAALVTLPFVDLPLLGPIAAGEPILADSSSESVRVIGETKANAGLVVQGDSMVPDFLDGDIVLVRLQDDVDDGQIAAVAIDDTVTLKRVYHISDGVQLISSNPKYAPMFFNAANSNSAHIIGLAVGFQRMF